METGTSYFFPLCSIFYSIMLVVVFFSKKRLVSKANKIYKYIILINFIALISELLCTYASYISNSNPFLSSLLLKLYVGVLVLWTLLFSFYVIEISYSKKYKSVLIYVFLSLFIISEVCAFVLPMYLFNENGIRYTYGPSTQSLVYYAGFATIFCIISLVINYKELTLKKYYPLLMFVIVSGVVSFLQATTPGLLIITSTHTLITFLMYFTIENPDMKLIEQLNFAKDQAEKANSAKTDFLSSMSHEIRTPLNAIVGFGEILASEDIPQDSKLLVNDIISASSSLVEIVNGILDISKIEANKLEIISSEYEFKKVFNDSVSLAKARLGAEKNIDFRYSYDESIPEYLYGDSVRLKQILVNLLTNAVKYTKEGFIDFKINSVLKDNTCRLIITVEDSGMGIKKEDITKLFTKFERLGVEKNTTTEGTGLGLAITKKLVELMNGNIVVQSEFRKGSKFTIVVDQRIVKIHKKEEEIVIGTSVIDVSDKLVLIVDDNELNVKVASRLLLNYNVNSETCLSGQACIDKINSGKKYDLILLDDMMPKLSGTETLQKLREKDSFKIPVVVLTANAISGMREKYLNNGFNDYLSKPIEKIELLRVINKYLK